MTQSISNTTAYRFISTVFNFLIALLLSRYLGPKVKGDATIIVTTITFLIFCCSFIGGHALVYLVPRFRVERLIIPAYIWSVLVVAVAYILFRYFHTFTWRRSVNICILSLLAAVVNIHGAILLAKQEIKRYNLTILLPVALTAFGLILNIVWFHQDSIYAYLSPLYAAYIISAFVSFKYCLSYFQRISLSSAFDDIDSGLKYGAGYQAFELLQLLNFRLYFYLLYHIQGASDLGLYSIGVSILEVAWILGRSVSIIHYSDFSNHENQSNSIKQTLRFLKLVFIASFIFLVIVACIPTSIYSLVFGQSFAQVKYLVKWLFPGVLIYNIALVIQSVYLSRASYGRLIFAQLVGLLFGVVFCYVLIPQYFFSGASAAASISFIFTSLILLGIFMKDYAISWQSLLPSRSDLIFVNNVIKNFLKKGKVD